MTTPATPTTTAAPAKCQACSRPMNTPLFCDHCRSLYPAEGLTHFELLGFQPRFDLDPGELRQRYLQTSRDVHPDSRGSAADSALSLRICAQLNEAHRVLADPVLRAEYLLEVCGGKSGAEDKSVPQDVLNTALTLREELEAARAADDEAACDEIEARARGLYEGALARITNLARHLPGDEQTRRQLRTTLNSIKYHRRLLETV